MPRQEFFRHPSLARGCSGVLLSSLIAISGPAFGARPKPLDQNVVVEQAASSDLIVPKVARDADGDSIVVWQGPDSDSTGIFARLYRSDGRPRGSSFQVNSCDDCAEGFQQEPDVAMNAAGDFVIVWETQNLKQDGDSFGVYARLYTAGGTPRTDVFRVNENTTSHQRDPVVAMDAQGNFAVAFESFTPVTTRGDVFVRRYNADGVAQGSQARVNAVTTEDQNHPDIAMSPDGSFVVAWETDDQDRPGQSVYFRRFAANGTAQGEEAAVKSGTEFQADTAVAADLRGNFLVLWMEASSGGATSSILGRILRNSGSVADEAVVVQEDSTRFLNVPAASGSVSGFTISWASRPRDSVLQGEVLVRSLQLNPTPPAALGPIARAFKPKTQQADASDIAADADGDFVVVVGGRPETATRDDILLSRFAAAEIDLAASLKLDRRNSGPLIPGATLLIDGTVQNLNTPANLNIPATLNDAIGLAQGIRLKGNLVGIPATGVLAGVTGRHWRCRVTDNSYDCRYERTLPAGESSSTLEFEIAAPDQPTSVDLRAAITSEVLDPRSRNDLEILNLNVACAIQISQRRFRLAENIGTREIGVQRLGTQCGTAQVSFDTPPGTAIAGADYTRASGVLSWNSNDQSTKIVNLVILDDALDEPDESLDFVLSAPSGTRIEGPSRAPVTIVDNDAASPARAGQPR